PYNDLEFYVFTRGPRLLNERRFGPRLRELGERLTPAAGMHVEFNVDTLARLREGPVTMFSYDLVSGHRAIWSDAHASSSPALAACERHLDAQNIPLSEATRLLFNRCSGLLFARALLDAGRLTREESDFVGRNRAKAQLALGDVVLAAAGEYHWSCRERQRRLEQLISQR